MLIGCLTAVIVSVYAPWYVAVLAALAAARCSGAIMAFFPLPVEGRHHPRRLRHQHPRRRRHGVRAGARDRRRQGHLDQPGSKAIPAVDLSFLGAIPGIGDLLVPFLSGHSVLSWLAAFLVFAFWYFLYRTPWGPWLRGVGEYPAAPEAAGIPVNTVRTWSLIVSGALAGLGGAQLAMFNYVGFTRDMTAGRGFIALGAVLLGARHPVGALLAALLFGVFEALAVVMPGLFNWMPAELIRMIPFVVTILALVLFSYRAMLARRTVALVDK